MEQAAAEQKWYQEWRNKPATKTALKLLKHSLPNTNNDLNITLHRIALACCNAIHYNRELDPGEIYRQKLQKERRQLQTLIKACHTLGLSAKRNDKSLMWACVMAEQDSGVRVTRTDHTESMNHNLVFERYFSYLEMALKGKLPELHGGPWIGRFTIGNLILEKPVFKGRPITTETMLAYELAFYLRMHTAGNAFDGIQSGQAMPQNGEPCFPIVANFCSAAFGTSWDSKQIGDNVRALKGVGLMNWQGVIWK
ncbi:MAG: hypothetical protein H0X02_09675 [Nitrosomonas sp.]|nr:hypothetical protein [Nitrosomonas sp.]